MNNEQAKISAQNKSPLINISPIQTCQQEALV